MNKFAQTLAASNKNIKEQRAERVARRAQDAQYDLIRDLESKRSRLEDKLDSLEDLQPTNSMSLKATAEDFDAVTWVTELQQVKVKIALLDAEIKIAQSTFDEYFSEQVEENTEA